VSQIVFVWKYLKGKRLVFVLGLILTLLTSAIDVVNPTLTLEGLARIYHMNQRDR